MLTTTKTVSFYQTIIYFCLIENVETQAAYDCFQMLLAAVFYALERHVNQPSNTL